MNKVTIYDISKKLNISAATVSRALNNNPKISIKTRELVLRTAAEMNYEQNTLALALKSGKSHTVGILVPYMDRSFFSSVIRGIEEELYPHGYRVIICQTRDDAQSEVQNINTLLNAQVDGIFMSVSKTTKDTSHIDRVLQKGVPLVFFDRKKNIKGVSSVTIDDFSAAYMSVEHLIRQGCKRIAHFKGDIHLEIYKDRYEGYLKALEDYNLPFSEDYVVQINSKVVSGTAAVKKLMQLPSPPDGIFSVSDFTALGAIQYLKKSGIRVPEDVCISGFSNESFTQYTEPTMTTIDQTPIKMGKTSARVFLEQIEAETVVIEKKVVLPPQLLIRDSSDRRNHRDTPRFHGIKSF
ncbi:LacI family DNA-binding transcriptional regulator [Sinomicrobium soli]|uniref:LacI family DNA-binding transcriptional regulator n=1 Tax=Sinomicrobium sp. N-1-3-6 TaxID=2219864 RepID=UPI000DCD5C47|nr:LacI family DNA-binding transcriptional regulator [Sinomicrobium sp. N-1-3-6]RAV29017.1 LacI family transcriptional regulator [Sinomicrobium sp. N-1-3-6]